MGKTGLPEAEAFLFAHMSGDGDLVHVCSADGETSHFLTGGADCLAHLRSPATLAAAGEAAGVGHHDAGVTALAAPRSGARFATGCEDGQVRVFSYPGGELAAIATRFTLPVRALAFTNDGALLAAGGDEDTIRLLDVSGEEPALRHTLQGTFRAVRSLAFDAKGELLVSCHEDGAVLVWDVAAGEVRHDLGKLAPSVARADWHAYNRCAWAPDGSRLAVPGRNNDVVLLSRDDDFAEVARLKDVHLGDVSVLAMSPNGLYCATAGMDLQVVVWELRKCVAVATSKLPEPATGLAWRTGADANALAVLTREGTAALWEAPVSARLPPPAKALEDVDMSDFEAPTAGGFVDDSAVDATGDGDGVDGEDDADGESSGGDGSDSAGGEDGAGKGRERRERIVMMPAPPAPQAQPQGAIAPGATPAMGAPPRRFLAYNTLGCVTCRDDGPVQHIETHFHDLERPGPRVPSHTDYLGVNLGALGPAGVACASPEKGETGATLMFRPFEGWSANAEWTLPFAAGEEAVALAAGGSFVAAATSTRLVRVITPMGVQQAVFALDGAPVALAAHGSLLAACWHAALPVGPPPGEQRLAFAVYDTDSGAQTASGSLPLTPGEQLTWLGFSEDGLLAACDSAGVLRLRTGDFGGAWVPVFSSSAARSSDAERHWVVGLSGAEVYAVVCKAPDSAPAVAPRPVLSLFPLAVPVLGAAAGAAGSAAAPALEEVLLRARMWAGDAARAHGPGSQPAQAAELELNKALLKLFNAALKGDRLGRAAELASHMTHAACLDGALKMANAARAVALAERITGIIHGRLAMEVEMGGAELAAEYPSQAMGGVAPRAQPAQAPAAKFARRPVMVPAADAVRADENDSPPARKREAKPAAEAPAAKRATGDKPAAAVNPFARKGRPQPCVALRRALALLLLATLAAPVSHAALTATSATIRVVAADVGAHSFSASLRATSSARVGKVAWVAWDTAACGSTASVADVQAKRDCNGTVLAGEVNLNTLWNPVEVRVGPGLLSQTNYTLFLTDGVNLIGLSVVTLDDTPPVYSPGTPRLVSVGERGVTFVATLNEPGRLRYVLQSSVASPPTLDDVLSGENSTQVELPVGNTAVTEYVLDGIQGDSSYALYIAASDLATPTPNTKARLEVLLFTTKLCDPCLAGRRLPLVSDCACAVGSPFQVRVGVLADDFDSRRFVRSLSSYLGLLPSQVLVTNVTTYGDPALVGDEYLSGGEIKLANLTNVTAFSDKTLVAFELLPLRPPWFLDLENVQLTSGVVNSTLVPSDQPSPWPGTFGGVLLISAPTLPGPPTTFIDEQSLPLGRVFPRYQAANPLLDLDGWVRPSVPAEAIGKRPNARFVFGATLGGGAVRGPCAACRFLCRLDVTRWEPCTSPYVVTGLTVGEHLLQVRAVTANGTMDPLAAFYTWAIDLGPWVGFVARPPAAVNTTLLQFAFASAAGCSLTYSLNGAASLPIAGVGSMSTPVLFTLPGTTNEGRNMLEVACTMADNTTVTAKHAWKLDTVAPAVTLLPGELAPGAVIHRDTATWLLEVNDTDAMSGPGSGVADVQCRLVNSTNATSPPPLFDWTPCPAALQGSVNATGLLALTNGSYALQLFATDHAGSACSVVAVPFVVDMSLPLTPSATVVDLVVTLTPAGTGSTPAYYKITNVVNGLLFLVNNATVAANSFVAQADAAAGLRFVPTPILFSGDTLGSTFGFDVQAADALKRLGGEVLHVSVTVPHINSAPVVDASQPLFMRDAYNTGAALYNTVLGELVADVLATGVTDADGDAVGLAVVSAASPLGAWEASADGGATWFALAAASAAWPILVGGGAFDRLRFVPQVDHAGVLSTTDWAATASLAFYAWDGSDGSAAGASCKLVSVDAPEADAAAVRNSSLFDLLVELRSAANGSTVCVPFDTAYDSAGPFSADAAVAVIRVFDVSSVRITDGDARAARSAAAAYADAVAGCPPKHPSAVDLPVSQAGAALMLLSGGAPLPNMAPPWTVEAWVRKRARLSTTVLMASSGYPAATSVALLLECSGAAFTIGVRRVGGWAGGAADLSFGVEAPLDTWTHLAFVDDGQVLALYVNGTLAAAPLALGGMPLPSGSVGYNRSVSAFAVDELRIWTVARSARQVAAAVQAQLPALGNTTLPSDGLLYSLRFEEGCGDNATDTASRNLTAVLVGGASFVRGVSLASVEVAGVFPEEGPPGGGGVLMLLGSGFPASPSADAVCVFSNGLVSPSTAVSATAVSCVVPPASGDGALLVSYYDPGRGCFAADGTAYTYASAFVAGIHPSQGPVAGGTLVTLSGSGFHAAPGAAQCRFACALTDGVAPTAEAWLVSASLLQCETPTQANASACFVEVSLNGGADWLPHPQLFTFVSTLLAAPLPQANGTFTVRHGSAELLQTGPTSGGGRLQLLLPPLDFGPLSRATLPACGIGTLRPLAARMSGANSIECASPARVRGAAPVTVSVNGRDWEQLGGVFGPRRFVTHSPPTAEAVLPEEAPAVGGTLLTVFGFGGAAAWDLSCAFGSSSADGVAPADARSSRGLGIQVGQGVQCVSPSVAPGFVAIRLAGDGVTGRHDGGVLQFLAREAPLTSNAFPRVLDAGGGTLLAVSGSHFAPSMLCAFANGTTAPVHFVSTALVQCEAPPGAPGLNTVAVLPALHGAAPPDDQDSGAVRVAYASGIADPAAAADGVPLGILCAFRTVRIAASAGPDGAVDCRLPAGFVESVPAGLGNNWQDVAYGSSDDNSTAWNATDGFNLTSTPGRLDELAAFPGAGSAAGFTQLSVFAAAAAQLPSAQLSCQFLEAGRVTTALAVVGSCIAPPALSSLGGFAVVRLVMSASGATLDVAETQFLYAPAARVTNVALPRVTALATDSRGRLHPGRLLWSGRPVAVSGAHFAGEAAIACRFGGEIRPAAWVSTALVRCELTDTAAVDPASPVAVAERAADDASWSAAASCAVFSWLR